MSRFLVVPLALLCASCSGGIVDRLEHTKWGNAAQPCSVNYATFDGGLIAFHPYGGTLPAWKINSIDAGWFSSRVDVRVELVGSVVKEIERQGHHVPANAELTLHLRIEGDQMRIDATTFEGVTKRVRPKSTLTMFNGFACPS